MKNKIKALVIGCGKIGALSDLNKEGIKTHVKAFSANNNFLLSVYDQDKKLAESIAEHYHIDRLEDLTDDGLSLFDVVIISTPTSTHYEYLKRLLNLKIRVIVCEKPIAASLKEIESIKKFRKKSGSKLLINYFRRFHPCYIRLKEYIHQSGGKPLNIQVTYQRGFLNNATHALDLLHFLFGPAKLKKVKIGSCVFDEFKDDPTVSLLASYNSIPVNIQGLQFAKFSFFEMRIWFSNKLICIEKNGESIKIYSAEKNDESAYYLPLEIESSPFDGVNAIQDAFRFVAENVERYIADPSLEDNFESSYIVNYQSLKIIDKLCHS